MKKLVVFLALLCLIPSFAFAEGELTVTQKNLIVFDDDDTGWFYARVENTGDEPIYSDSGSLVLFTPDDEILLTESYVRTSPSYMLLNPGEYAYVSSFLWDSALEDNEVGDVKFSIGEDDDGYEYETIPSEAEMDLEGVDSYENYINVTFTNSTDEILYDFAICVAMTDTNGDLVFVDSDSTSTIGLHPGSSMTIKVYVDNDLMTYYDAHGITPAAVDSYIVRSIDE